MTVQYRPGAYCDVAVWVDGRLLQAVAHGASVLCYLEDTLIWQVTTPEPLLFLRCAVQADQLLTISQGHDSGLAWLVNDRLTRGLGPTFGVQPVGIDGHEAYIVRDANRYDREGLITVHGASPVPGSSQGLSDVQPDGTLWWADLYRTLTINGTVFTYPNQRPTPIPPVLGGQWVTVGQVDPPGIAAAVGSKITRVIEGDAYEPHVAVSPNGRVAICARTPNRAAYVATTIQELS